MTVGVRSPKGCILLKSTYPIQQKSEATQRLLHFYIYNKLLLLIQRQRFCFCSKGACRDSELEVERERLRRSVVGATLVGHAHHSV